jgi:hypothetical protein
MARVWERSDADRVVVGKYEGKRSFGIPRHRCEDHFKVDH